jgi:hypothetical protein
MKGLLKKEFIPLRGFKPKGVEVYFWDTCDNLIGHREQDDGGASKKLSKDNSEFHVVAGLHIPRAFWNSSKSVRQSGKTNVISELHFTVEHWGIEIVTHELTHLVFWMQVYFSIEALTCIEMQEKWCYAIGETAETIAKTLLELGK